MECLTCKYYKEPECRRYPPTINGFQAINDPSKTFCGEHETKETENVEKKQKAGNTGRRRRLPGGTPKRRPVTAGKNDTDTGKGHRGAAGAARHEQPGGDDIGLRGNTPNGPGAAAGTVPKINA